MDRKGLERLAQSISRYLGPEETLRFGTGRDHSEEFRFETSRPLGGGWVLKELWKQLAMDKVLEKLLEERTFQSPVERTIFALVANRALAPTGPLQGRA